MSSGLRSVIGLPFLSRTIRSSRTSSTLVLIVGASWAANMAARATGAKRRGRTFIPTPGVTRLQVGRWPFAGLLRQVLQALEFGQFARGIFFAAQSRVGRGQAE